MVSNKSKRKTTITCSATCLFQDVDDHAIIPMIKKTKVQLQLSCGAIKRKHFTSMYIISFICTYYTILFAIAGKGLAHSHCG